jgi:hypothetical protein
VAVIKIKIITEAKFSQTGTSDGKPDKPTDLVLQLGTESCKKILGFTFFKYLRQKCVERNGKCKSKNKEQRDQKGRGTQRVHRLRKTETEWNKRSRGRH